MNLNNQLVEHKRLEEMIVRYYNEIAGTNVLTYDEIPEQAQVFLSGIEYRDLIRPFVLKDLRKGLEPKIISLRYRIKRSTIRGIGRQFGFNKRRPVHPNRITVRK